MRQLPRSAARYKVLTCRRGRAIRHDPAFLFACLFCQLACLYGLLPEVLCRYPRLRIAKYSVSSSANSTAIDTHDATTAPDSCAKLTSSSDTRIESANAIA